MARKTGKTTQTWRAFPANGSDMARKSGAHNISLASHTHNVSLASRAHNVSLGAPSCETCAVFPQLLSGARSLSAITFELPANHPSNCKNVILDSTNQIYRLVSAQKMNEMIGSNSDTTQNQREQNRT